MNEEERKRSARLQLQSAIVLIIGGIVGLTRIDDFGALAVICGAGAVLLGGVLLVFALRARRAPTPRRTTESGPMQRPPAHPAR